ncbi:MAG: hypothetical protein U0Q18_32210 [Bryobacteraceae bacterium]
MRPLLLTAADQYQGKPGSPEHWERISAFPAVMGEVANKRNRCLLEPAPLADEEH